MQFGAYYFELKAYHFLYLAILIVSIVLWPKVRTSIFRWLPFFILFLIITEIYARWLAITYKYNLWLFSLTVPVEYLFNAFLLKSDYYKSFYRSLAQWFLILFPVFAIFKYVTVGLGDSFTSILQTGSFLMIVLSIIWFLDFYERMETEVISREPMFWIATGLLLFNGGEFLYNLFYKFLVQQDIKQMEAFANIIQANLNNVLYTTYIIALLCIPKSLPYKKT